jgi:hypothetical protein
MQTRTQYLIFLSIWAGVLLIGLLVATTYGFVDLDNARGSLILFSILALIPAAGGYVLILKCRSLIDRWRAKRGGDVYQRRRYEDDSGILHLTEVAGCERQEEVELNEMVSGMKPLLDQAIKDPDKSD